VPYDHGVSRSRDTRSHDFGGAMPAILWALLVVLIGALSGASARAQDLDQDKSGAKLFAATCADCHRSPRGLAKQRLGFMLSYYLRQHYTSSSASAQALAAYLQEADAPRAKPAATSQAKAAKPRDANRKPEPVATGSLLPQLPGEPIFRPPASIPRR
jgi:mono/diheme cytochrome c family protein